MTTLLLIILVLILVGALPAWPHAKSYGWGPSGLVAVLLIVLLVLVLTGHL